MLMWQGLSELMNKKTVRIAFVVIFALWLVVFQLSNATVYAGIQKTRTSQSFLYPTSFPHIKKSNVTVVKTVERIIEKKQKYRIKQNYVINDTTYMFGVMSVLKMEGRLKPFTEIDSRYPEAIYSHLQDSTDQVYSYQKPEFITQGNNSLYNYDPKFYLIPRAKHFSFYAIPKVKYLNDLFNPYYLVMFIKSRITNVEERLAIRNTYGQSKYISKRSINAKIYFLVSFTNHIKESKKIFKDEQREYNDLIMLNILESHENLTLKVIMASDLFVIAKATTPFVYFGDDDTCVNVPKLVSKLREEPMQDYHAGHVEMSKYSQKFKHRRLYYPKSAIPKNIQYTAGHGYILSNNVLYRHQQVIRRIPEFTHLEDLELSYFSDISKIPVRTIKHFRLPIKDAKEKHIKPKHSSIYLFIQAPNADEMEDFCQVY
ncbi:hypothetical protein WA158_007817 [Blastocystis sp. Blastoise]